MFKKVKKQDLRIGMFVILPPGFMQHKFQKHQLLIENEELLENMLRLGLDDYTVDVTRSPYFKVREIEKKEEHIYVPEDWDATRELIPYQLKEVIRDKKIEPQKKAGIVYTTSVKIMEKLMDSPTTENIRQYKDGVNDMVSMILGEPATSNFLLGITSHDFYTYTHSVNVGVLSLMLAKKLFSKSSSHDMNELGAGFFLHDLGKTRIQQNIITKEGKLTVEEFDEMKKHPNFGYVMLKDAMDLSNEIKVIVQQHHERYDGSGYPYGLYGDDIHLYGRLCCIADVYDALTSRRPYKQSMTPFQALTLMKKEMIHHFDTEMFEKFVLLFA